MSLADEPSAGPGTETETGSGSPRPRRPRPSAPIGFAHRGARAECRDNTLYSFARALQLGAQGLESDVWLTADGVAVLDHDGTVRRGLRTTPIGQVPRADLPNHIPTLAQLYELCGADVEVSLDVKDGEAAAAAIDVASAAGALPQLWLCGAGPLLRTWRALSDEVRLVESTRYQDGFEDQLTELAAGGVDAVNLHGAEWSQGLVDAVHAAGMAAFAWDLQSPASLAALLALGVDGVYSDHVATMLAALAAG